MLLATEVEPPIRGLPPLLSPDDEIDVVPLGRLDFRLAEADIERCLCCCCSTLLEVELEVADAAVR